MVGRPLLFERLARTAAWSEDCGSEAPRPLGCSRSVGICPLCPQAPEVRGPLSWGRAADSELGVRPAWAWALLAALGGLLPSRPGLSGL